MRRSIVHLREAVSVFIVTELAKGLDALHHASDETGRPLGLVHRDVSPSNVLISRRGEVKLGDFGIAKATLLREITRAGIRKGTHAYMSPEQVSGRPLTAASDQFALGVVLHELLFGTRPIDGAPMTGPYADVLRRLLQRDPLARFTSMRAVFDALKAHAASSFELAELFRNF